MEKLIDSRKLLAPPGFCSSFRKVEGEGGCGVIGMACEEKIAGRHLLPALEQMRNRGNGKGGGIAAVGLSSSFFGISPDILETDYLVAIAYLDRSCQTEIEKNFIHQIFEIDHIFQMPHIEDFKTLKGLDVSPPEALLYFVRVKECAIREFQEKYQVTSLPQNTIEDEIVYQNSYRLNHTFYASSGEKRAFVLSHGKNLLVLKMVGYGDDVIRYYQLKDFRAHIWIGHHRYPTKGKVWHPGGAHPFVGLHEALVHNGDFANYSSICEYLAQRNIYPLFLTDTEVSALIFDLFCRTYQYPLEYVIEALAPTTERDFFLLPDKKRHVYQAIQKTHIQGSPDGPWFFLIAQSLRSAEKKLAYSLIGITDTSMLRPQVFALQKGAISIGFAASEKQAIDASLRSLADEDCRFWPCADYYWNARGGSHTDGGAFIFTIHPETHGKAKLVCSNKFGHLIHTSILNHPDSSNLPFSFTHQKLPDLSSHELFMWIKKNISGWRYEELKGFLDVLWHDVETDQRCARAIEVLTKLYDQRYPMGQLRRSSVLALLDKTLSQLLKNLVQRHSASYAHLTYEGIYPSFEVPMQILIIDAIGFPAEGERSLSAEIIRMYERGFKKIIVINCRGQRFIANGLGANSQGLRIDIYGSSGDYLASGIDGAEVYVHGNAQDQLAQIMKEGTLVVYGDVGQTFMYGAKGGTAFVLGNAAGRPLINAVGKPRVVINGTCLDYLAESFMAGNPLKDGGFVIVNGVTFDEAGDVIELDTPYPGSNLFSLASGGAIYIRDPIHKITKEQLNGGEFVEMTKSDWDLVLAYLEENARLFDIPIHRLLEYNRKPLSFQETYRKISPARVRVLHEEEAWVKGRV